MRTLADCLKIHGGKLDADYIESIKQLAAENKAAKYEAHQAELMAVASVMETVEAEKQEIFNQLEEKKDDLRNIGERDQTEYRPGSVQRQRIDKAFEREVGKGAAQISAGNSPIEKAYGKVAQLFGLDTIFFTSKNPWVKSVGGFMFPGVKNEIYINAQGVRGVPFLVGHETLHQLEANHPEIYNWLVSKVIIPSEAFAKFKQETIEARGDSTTAIDTDAKFIAEYLGDFTGKQFQDPVFWQKMYAQNKSFTKQIVKIIKDILKKISGTLDKGEKMVLNFDEAQDALVSAMSQFAERGSGKATKIVGEAAAVFQPLDVAPDVSQAQDSGVNFSKAPADYPDSLSQVYNHTNLSTLKRHPDYKNAKHGGDVLAAKNVVDELVKPKVIGDIQKQLDPGKKTYIAINSKSTGLV